MISANFRKRDSLERGQLITTISGMRDAMSHRVGYRKIRPTRDQIRNAYEALKKASLITTTRTTRGMVITICSYDVYQDPKSYERHTEDHNENPPRTTVTPHDTERRTKEQNEREKIYSRKTC